MGFRGLGFRVCGALGFQGLAGFRFRVYDSFGVLGSVPLSFGSLGLHRFVLGVDGFRIHRNLESSVAQWHRDGLPKP